MTPENRDWTKLPKWAQQELRNLTAQVAYLEDQVMRGSRTDTDTFVRRILKPTDYGLERGASIRFATGPRAENRLGGIAARLDPQQDGRLVLHSTMGDGLDVRPMVSNMLSVGVVSR